MTVDFNYPYTITPDTPATAAEVQQNFAQLLSWIKVNYRQVDDTPNLTVVPVMPGLPTIASHATSKAYVDAIVPTGTISAYAGTSAPPNYLLCDGASYSTTGTYASLFAVIGYAYGGAAGSFNVPNLGGRVIVGRTGVAPFTMGATGGVADAIIAAHTHTGAPHTHTTPDHVHTAATVEAGNHLHSGTGLSLSAGGDHNHTGGLGGLFAQQVFGGDTIDAHDGGASAYGGTAMGLGGTTTNGAHSHTVSGNTATNGAHTHTVTFTASGGGTTGSASAASTGETGESPTNKNYPPYVIANYIIKT
jgi:microcystin-dependent protein